MTQNCGGGEEELPTIVRKNYRAPWKPESLRHFLVIPGRAGPSALGTLKHCLFPSSSHSRDIYPTTGPRTGCPGKIRNYPCSLRAQAGGLLTIAQSVLQRGRDCPGEHKHSALDAPWIESAGPEAGQLVGTPEEHGAGAGTEDTNAFWAWPVPGADCGNEGSVGQGGNARRN